MLVLALQLVLPTQAMAWVSDGMPAYRPGTVRYWAAPMSPVFRAEVTRAAQAWNRSGARVRLVASTRSTAQILVMAPRGTGCRAWAFTDVVDRARSRSTITWNFCSAWDTHERSHVMTHEFGHALGLDHDDRRCAIMTDLVEHGGVSVRCGTGSLDAWEYYCRMLEADDVRGIVARYGGTARLPTGPRLCSRGPAPSSVGAVTVTYDSFNHDAIASWTNPSGSSATTVRALWMQGTCPTGPDDYGTRGHTDVAATPGAATVTWDSLPFPGPLCAYVQPFDRYGQPGVASTATLTYP